MIFTSHFQSFFDSATISRGMDYYYENKIYILESWPEEVRALAYGSREYIVRLKVPKPNHLDVSCECPYSESRGGPCKHIWAALSVLAGKGWGKNLPGPSSRVTLRVFLDDSHRHEVALFGDDCEPDSDYTVEGGMAGRGLEKISSPGAERNMPANVKPLWDHILTDIEANYNPLPPSNRYSGKQIIYQIDIPASAAAKSLILRLMSRQKRQDGTWGAQTPFKVTREKAGEWPEATDGEIMSALLGAGQPEASYYNYYYPFHNETSAYSISPALLGHLLRSICATGRANIKRHTRDEECPVLSWDEDAAWVLKMSMIRDKSHYRIEGKFARNTQTLSMQEPHWVTNNGYIFWKDKVGIFESTDAFNWLSVLKRHGSLQIPLKEGEKFLEKLYNLPGLPALSVPEELQLREFAAPLKKELVIYSQTPYPSARPLLLADVACNYDGNSVPLADPRCRIIVSQERKLIIRDAAAEENAINELLKAGFKQPPRYIGEAAEQQCFTIARNRLSGAIIQLLGQDWRVEAEGKLYRKAGSISIHVNSEMDWFEVRGKALFDELDIPFPKLLAALKKGEGLVRLGDGSVGILPEEWLRRYSPLAQFGTAQADRIVFKPSQALLLDAMLAEMPEVSVDAYFKNFSQRLCGYGGVKPMSAPHTFKGVLRDYQKEGLGWFAFLREFEFGGCLADDMGLGKTVQVLALLEAERISRNSRKLSGPHLVVVPRSLLFNWKEEAAKFTPKLSVLIYSGTERGKLWTQIPKTDLVVTTYGTLRRDIHKLAEIRFGYVALDESQAIKNAKSQAAKACRLLQARQKLALSGTPIENHIGELWSLFEFINPGMLGKHTAFNAIKNDESREMLRRALRPFILRRTKNQVIKELPEKTEQIIYCEMEKEQRNLYTDLKKYYQASLLKKIEQEGMKGSQMHILEALLRLRQSACHPGLVNSALENTSSAKLDSVWEQMREVISEGHKVLIFSQFTSLLRLLRVRLDREKISYLYLDGQTRKRQEIVERFQNDSGYPVFLISLKAGGLGLNLTAAEYVFILDPWWNPAVEAQAVDRIHRIGQTRPVFAYRFISRDTVEEKVLQLQDKKRKLVEQIISQDSGLFKNLSKEDLSFLLT